MNERYSGQSDYDDPRQDRESDRIRRNIDQTLCEMDGTVEQIQERLHPRALMHQAKEAIISPAGVIGIGIAWMLINRMSGRAREERYELGRRYAAERTWAPSRVGSAVSRARDAVTSAAHQAKDKAAELSSRAGDAIHSAQDAATDAVHSAREAATDLGHTVRDQVVHGKQYARVQAAHAGEAVQRGARYARDQASDLYEENPLAVGAAALAAGIVGGLLLPSTRQEDRIMGRVRDDLLDSAKGVGRDVLETGKGVVRAAAETAREEVQNAESRPVAQRAADALGKGLQAAGQEVQNRAGPGQAACQKLA